MARRSKGMLSPTLKKLKYYFNILTKGSDSYLYIVDMDAGVALLSPNFVRDFEFPAETVSFDEFREKWLRLIHPEERGRIEDSLTALFMHEIESHDESYRVKQSKGDYLWVHCVGKTTIKEDGHAAIFAGTVRRLAQRNQADEITGLLNKYQLEREVNQNR